jgi:hypothetical protein
MGISKDYFGWSPAKRQNLFYGVCIWARFALAGLAGWLADAYTVPVVPIILVLAVLSLGGNTYRTFKPYPGDWWSHQVHAYSALVVVATCILALADRQVQPYTIGVFLALDVVYGVGFSLITRPFKQAYQPVQRVQPI